MSFLNLLGWSESLAQQLALLAPKSIPARVLEVQRSGPRVRTEEKEWNAEYSGRLRRELEAKGIDVCVGDWIYGSISGGLFVLEGILPRVSFLARLAAGGTGQMQSMVANADELWILNSCNHDLSPERIERYISMARDGNVVPVVVLTKIDLVMNEYPAVVEALQKRLVGVEIIAISVEGGTGLSHLLSRLRSKKSIALMGSSGVGKSTLINHLLESAAQLTTPIRESDSKGRHATTTRKLFVTKYDACVIDTPGLRELALSGADNEEAFPDVIAITRRCRFRDCTHRNEPGCAIQKAVKDGSLQIERWKNYYKLQKELEFHEQKLSKTAYSEQKKEQKKLSKEKRGKKKINE